MAVEMLAIQSNSTWGLTESPPDKRQLVSNGFIKQNVEMMVKS